MRGGSLLGKGMRGLTQDFSTMSQSRLLYGYNGYSFNTGSFLLSAMPDIHSVNNADLRSYDISTSFGAGLDQLKYQPKRFTIRGTLSSESASSLDSEIDVLKSKVLQPGKTFTYTGANGITKEAKAYCVNIDIPRESYHITFVEVALQFVVLDPFFYGLDTLSTHLTNKTSNFGGSVVYLSGSVPAQPYVSINFVNGTASGCQFTLNNQTISINEALVSGDSLIIDCGEKDVIINGEGGKNYSGVFPVLPIGEVGYNVVINGTFNVNFYISWKNTYV